MNIIFAAFVLTAFLFAGWRQICWIPSSGDIAPMEALSKSMIESAAGSVELAIGLVGVMTLFLGLVKIAEAGGMLTVLARLIRPLMIRLFPEVPTNHPAMGAMILNMAANALGLGNAATPFGIRAMQELDKLNTQKGTATNAMALFLAINTSSITLLPTGVIALRAAAGSTDPAGILPTTLFATIGSTVAAIGAAKLYQRFFPLSGTLNDAETSSLDQGPSSSQDNEEEDKGYPLWVSLSAMLGLLALVPLSIVYGKSVSPWMLPCLMLGFLVFGLFNHVRVYEILRR